MVVPSAPSPTQPTHRLRHREGRVFSKRQLVIASTLVGMLSAILAASLTTYYLQTDGTSCTINASNLSKDQKELYGDRLILPVDKPYRRSISHPKYDAIFPQVAWLMSFPNSGTSFTLRYIRRTTNTTTATNYALEGQIKDQPSVPIHPDVADKGPWLELNTDRPTNIPERYILTKTHCEGMCSDCVDPDRFLFASKSFRFECQGGSKAVWKDASDPTQGVVKQKNNYYHKEQVKKAIHIFRHPVRKLLLFLIDGLNRTMKWIFNDVMAHFAVSAPPSISNFYQLDNIVARYHLVWKREVNEKQNKTFEEQYPYNSTGFRAWCQHHDEVSEETEHYWYDQEFAQVEYGSDLLCLQEFFQYVKWHNLAFAATRELNIPALIIYYEDYSENMNLASDRMLDFLELEEAEDARDVNFIGGKTYHDYFTQKERQEVERFIEQIASDDTWERLQYYFRK